MLKTLFKTTILLLAIITLVGGGYLYFQHQQIYPSTDDAYVQANTVQVAPQVSGKVDQIYVQNHQYVKTGQLLFTIDPAPFILAVNQAQANLDNTVQQVLAAESAVKTAEAKVAQAQAQLTNVTKIYNRTMSLVKKQLYSIASGDTALSDLRVAQATLKASQDELAEAKQKLGKPGDANATIREAQASLAQTKLNLSYTKVVSPSDGYLVQFLLNSGADIVAYQPQFSIVENSEWWISANFKETDLERIRPGQPAKIKLDMYPDHVFKGIVNSISAGSGSTFSILPAEEATGNWVKVTQRFPVRVTIFDSNKAYPLRMGASASVVVDTTSAQLNS